MLKKTIFDESTVGFFLNDQFGAYMGFLGQIIIENGKTYTVIWDGASYTCTAFEANFEGMAGIAIGNTSFIWMEDTGEPFIIGVSDGSGFAFTPYTQASHSVSIYQETFVILQDRHGVEQEYSVPNEKIKLNTSDGSTQIFSAGEAIENVPISLDFSNGDQTVTADNGYFVKSAIIKKPVDLVAGNVRLGKAIAGIEGDFVGDTEEKIISGDTDLTFADGESFLIKPSSAEKVISKVTISPPSALVPENIAKDVTIAGITGTHEGGGSGGGGGDIVAEKDVKFYDYDGTLLYEYTVAEANALSELPALPTHDGLICQGWNYSLDKVKTLTSPTNIGAMYITDDGKTRVHIANTSERSTKFTFYWKQTIENGVTIDWGDGSGTISVSGIGEVSTTHNYTAAGCYIISFDVVDGCTFTLGSGASNKNFCEGGTSNDCLVTSIEIGDADVEIPDYAFYDLASLRNINIPSNVTNIGNSAFSGCYALMHINIPDSVTNIGNYAFQNCKSLQNVTIPDSVTIIGENAFRSCYGLQNVTIPDSMTSIGNYAFYVCFGLQNVTIPDSVTSIGNYAFYSCYGLRNVTIPDSVTSIGNYAFQNCYGLRNVTIPDSVTSIGNYAFQKCYGLRNVTILDSVTSISDYAFQNCYGLRNVTIPDSVTSIGNYAFQSCYGLQNINIPDSVTNIGNSAFSGCYALMHINIPDSVTNIGTYAFSGCQSLQNVTISKNVTSIADSVFRTCDSLTNITIPDGVTSIGTYAFYYSRAIRNITIPPSVTSIGNHAFSLCYGCRTYDFSHFTTIPTLGGTSAFSTGGLTIKVPSALLSSWKTKTNWSSFASYMVGV